MKIWPKYVQNNAKYTLKIFPMTFNILPKWRNFAKFVHTEVNESGCVCEIESLGERDVSEIVKERELE